MIEALFNDYTLRTVALGAAILGVVAGALGAFAVLRGQSLLGDAVAHAALPGVALAFLLTGSKAPLPLALGAAATGWLGSWCVRGITARSRVPFDAALGLVLAAFFGAGVVLLSLIQRRPDATQAGLDAFLFGQAAALVGRDVVVMGALGAGALLVAGFLWKELKLLLFDPDFAASVGLPVRRLDGVLTLLLVVAIVVGLQTVGVVLMSAMLIAPAAAARQWTDRFGAVVGLAAVFGAVSGVAGALASAGAARVPTGPAVVLCAGALVFGSVLFAPRRGLVAAALRARRHRTALRPAGVLQDLYTLALGHADPRYGHTAAVLRTMTVRPESVGPSLAVLARRGLVEPAGEDAWAITAAGLREAERLAGRREEAGGEGKGRGEFG